MTRGISNSEQAKNPKRMERIFMTKMVVIVFVLNGSEEGKC
jgi:hypothetical protein